MTLLERFWPSPSREKKKELKFVCKAVEAKKRLDVQTVFMHVPAATVQADFSILL